MHPLSARLKDGVELGAMFDDLPGAVESRGHHKPLAATELPAFTLEVLECHPAFGEAEAA